MNQMSSIRPAAAPGGLDEGFDGAVARMVPIERLMAEKDELRARYLAAKPYPHLVLDNFFDPAVLDRVAAEFPGRGGRDWLSYDTANEIKQTSRGALDLPAFSQAFLPQIDAPPILQGLRQPSRQAELCVVPRSRRLGTHESRHRSRVNMPAD